MIVGVATALFNTVRIFVRSVAHFAFLIIKIYPKYHLLLKQNLISNKAFSEKEG